MAMKQKNGYKFSETALGAFIEKEKEREGKFNTLRLVFALVFGVPIAYLVLATLWKLIKWIFSIA
jgi:hypothetical protein